MSMAQARQPGDTLQLMSAVREGDQQALAGLYRTLCDRVYSLALRILCVPADAEEVVVDVFQQVWSQAGSYDRARGTPESWVMRIAYTRTIDTKRRRKARPDWNDSIDIASVNEDLLSQSSEAERLLDAFDAGSAVFQAIQNLSGDQRRCTTLWFLDGLTQQEIAARLSLPLGTVKSHLYRANKVLRERLSKAGWR